MCGYGKYHKAPLFTEEFKYTNGKTIEVNHHENFDLPVSEELSDHLFLLAPRFEKDCKDLINQYAEAYYKVVNHPDELKEYEKKNNVNVDKSNLDMIKAIRSMRSYRKQKSS